MEENAIQLWNVAKAVAVWESFLPANFALPALIPRSNGQTGIVIWQLILYERRLRNLQSQLIH